MENDTGILLISGSVRRKIFHLIPLFIIYAVIIGITGFILGTGGSYNQKNSPHIPLKSLSDKCTLEMSVCPDGSRVGRAGPRCEFARCPQMLNEMISPDLMQNQKYYEFDKSKFCPEFGDCNDFGLISRECNINDNCIASCAYGCVSDKWINGRSDCEAIWDNFSCSCTDGICQRKK
jgi:hypothetical protein